MDVKLNNKQYEAYCLLADQSNGISEVLYGGGARGGKSFLGCLWQITSRMKYAGSIGFICRREYSRLVDTTMSTFFEILRMLDLESYGFLQTAASGDKSANTYYFPNSSKIYFRYIDRRRDDPNYDRFGSYSLTDMFIDEAQEIDEKAISVLRGRFSLLQGVSADGSAWQTIPKVLFSCNPKKNWIYNDFVRPFNDGNLQPYRAFIKALPKDNPYVSQAYLDNLLRSDKVTVQRLYYGNFEYDDDPSALVDYDAICDLFANEHVQAVGGRSGAADIATKGHDRFVVTAWTGNVCRIAVDKTYSPGKEVYEDVRNTMAQYGIPRSLMVVDADGIGGYLESFLPGIKEFHAGNRPSDPRYANLKAECAFMLADLIQRRAMRIVSDDADQVERIKTELAVLKQADIDKDTGKKNIISKDTMKEMLGHSPDYLDALIMAMYFRRAKLTQGATINITSYGTE